MQQAETWKPTIYAERGGAWHATLDSAEVGVGSRLVVEISADVCYRAINGNAKGRLIDVGCGKIPYYGMYRNLITESVCVDWANTAHLNPHIDHFVDLNGALPFADAEFDTVLCTDVLEHIARPDFLWAEMSRILRPKGKLLLAVPFLYGLHEEPYDYHRFTAHKLRMFCADHGLTLNELEAYGGAPDVIFDVVSKLLASRPPLATAWYRFAWWLLRKTPVSRISARTRARFPLGYFLVAEKPA